jgi:YggT family protein
VSILCNLLSVYTLVLFARAVLSFFPIGPDSGLAPIQRALFMLTEPILAPIRRVVPPLGIFDTSFIVLVFIIIILQNNLCSGHRVLF